MQTTHSTATEENTPPNAASSDSRKGLFRREYLALLVIILLLVGIRFRLRDMPLERDEGEYAYAGQLILQGIPPYELAYNMKLPGTYAAYALIMAAFGQTSAGIHAGVMVVNAACILLVFMIARKLFDPMAATVAAATFGLFSIRPQLLGLAGHATHFVTLAALASIYLLLSACATGRSWLFFWSGIFSGLAFLMKQPGVFFGIFAALYLLWREWPSPGSARSAARKVTLFSAAAMLPYLLTCLLLLRAGLFQKFWFWTVSYARAYGSELRIRDGLQQFANRMELQRENVGLIWMLILFGMAAFLWNRKFREHAVFVLGLLSLSFLAVSVGLYFRGHYFIVLYPALALLAGAGVSSACELLRRPAIPSAVAATPLVLFALASGYALYAERSVYFQETPHDAARELYGTNPFPEAVGVAAYLRANSNQDSRIAVIGSEPEIYFYAQRHSATGYIYTYPLVEDQAYASVMQADFIREVEAAAPEFVVYVLIERSWLRRPNSDTRIFLWADAYTRQHYALVGIADGGNHDVYRWGQDAPAYRPRRPEVVLIYKRNIR